LAARSPYRSVRKLVISAVVTMSLVGVSAAEAHTLYYGPARGAALRYARALANAINQDTSNPYVATSYGVTGCTRISDHSFSCKGYVLGHDSNTGLRGRCDAEVLVRLVSATSRLVRVTARGPARCG
jgi:hypothetical protein